jgi:hypothetical protein
MEDQMTKFLAAVIAMFSLLASAPAVMADDVRTERVQFERGASGATVKGTITGREAMHYLIGAKAGQVMDVTLATRNTSTYFNIFAPGRTPGQSEAMFIGNRDGDHFTGALTATDPPLPPSVSHPATISKAIAASPSDTLFITEALVCPPGFWLTSFAHPAVRRIRKMNTSVHTSADVAGRTVPCVGVLFVRRCLMSISVNA